MNFKNKCKKLGFSLMEILIAIFIVAILTIVTLPVINKQLNKTNEYSYYLAYRTVEKLAGQIVALGDPKDDLSYVIQEESLIADNSKNKVSFADYISERIKSSPINSFLANLSNRFAYTQTYILSRFVPKAVAASVSTSTQTVSQTWYSWDNEIYDELWLKYQICGNGKENVFKKKKTTTTSTSANGTTTTTETFEYYTKSDVDNCVGVTVGKEDSSGAKIYPHDNLKEELFEDQLTEILADGLNYNSVAEYIKDQNKNKSGNDLRPDAMAFCGYYGTLFKVSPKVNDQTHNIVVKYIENDIATDDSEDDNEEEGNEEVLEENQEGFESPQSEKPGTCIVGSTYELVYDESDSDQYVATKPTFPLTWCTENGYANMNNGGAPNSIYCECMSNYVMSTNSEKACVPPCRDSSELPYARLLYTNGKIAGANGICCSTDFNESTGACCPEKSMYNHATSKCECVSGYKMEGNVCKLETCPPGSHKTDDGVCVVNPPITSAKRLCEEITEQWNVADSSCNTFTKSNDFNYHLGVYNAALDKVASKTFLSVNSKIGAFKNIIPNIEFSNGLKMWILGDKAASIPGLSYFNPTITSTQNMCHRKKLTTNTAIACYNEGGYFCKNENTCLILDPQTKTSGAIGDARACCSAMDVSDLQSSAEGSGDPNAWKKDQRVYGISGFTVFVDINGDKGDGTLWDDVFPFFIGANGIVYPGYPLDAPKGSTADAASTLLYTAGNSDKDLPVDVYYYLPTDKARQRKVAFSGVSYARGMCSARRISKHTPYCMNLGEKFVGGDGLKAANCPTSGGCTSATNLNGNAYIEIDGKESRNPCDHYNCFVAVRKKLKSF